MTAKELPARPNLDRRKQAKDLLESSARAILTRCPGFSTSLDLLQNRSRSGFDVRSATLGTRSD